MDPQQRFLLEVAYEAFENAGIPLDELAGSNTGCYVGAYTSDWRDMQFRDSETAPLYSINGTGLEFLSNRISWFYDLKGPSMTIDTACSSSLVAIHQACQNLRSGESEMVLVGGTSLLLNPDLFLYLSNQGFLAQDGRSKSFDASGDGYGRGEGCAAVVLKRVEDALRDGNPIRAVIRGSGVNSDGRTKGITLPSTDAQANLIRSVYKSADLDMKSTAYVEAHVSAQRLHPMHQDRTLDARLHNADWGYYAIRGLVPPREIRSSLEQ
jgi:zearalenone synthase (highly reducing iterative type I polyketide synthase)